VNRRGFITLLGGALATPSPLWPRASRAQQPKMLRVGFSGILPQGAPHYVAFERRMAAVSSIDVPVMFPPGRARVATCPRPTGSAWTANTMGMVVVACLAASTNVDDGAKITSTFMRTCRGVILTPKGRTAHE
jgi:hypothetical protein